MTRTVWRCKTATRFSPARTCTCADMHGWLVSTRTCTVKQRHTQPNLKWVKLSQTVVNKRCLLALLGHRNTGHHFCIVRTHKNMQTHTRIYTQPAPTSSNSYTHSFQKTFLHYFSLHTHFISSLSHTHTRSLRLPRSVLRYHHCYTTPLGNWGFSSQLWVHTRAAIRRRCLLLFSSCPSLFVTLCFSWSVLDLEGLSFHQHSKAQRVQSHTYAAVPSRFARFCKLLVMFLQKCSYLLEIQTNRLYL